MFFLRYVIFLPFLLFLLTACGDTEDQMIRTVEYGHPIDRDFDAITESDTLRVLTMYNSTSYFLYRGQPMGYEYELLHGFAEAHDLNLQFTVVSDRDSLFLKLNEGEGDLVAARIIPAVADTAHIAFTRAIHETRPMLVQRQTGEDPDLPATADSLLEEGPPGAAPDTLTGILPSPDNATAPPDQDGPQYVEIRARLIRTPEELAGERVHLQDDSPYYERLVELQDTITGDIHIVELEEASSEEAIIRMISEGHVNYTVAPENLAKLNSSYYENLRVEPYLGESHRIAWAVRPNATRLRAALNDWIEGNPGMRQNLYQKYYVDRRGYNERVEDEYLANETGRLSEWDDLFKRHAPQIAWDWRLLASQCYQESQFKPDARSWAGAMGLLQLMPGTAREVNVSQPYDPEQNVAGAVRYLQFLEDHWRDKIADETERRKFILASYNAGFGHVADAQRLADKYGADSQVWDDVAYWMLQKSKARYYRDPVVRYGFVRGLEPVTYVSRILNRYDHYRQFVEPEAQAGPETRSRRTRF